MLIRRFGAALFVRAPAKVNLFLELLGKRADGYHELETLLVAVNLYDSLEMVSQSGGAINLECTQPGLPTGPDNLVCRAAVLLKRYTGHAGGAAIRLVKRIPMAAGLGGGSSDAAATLAGLNCLWRLGLGWSELARLGAELGSDVSFFFRTPAAWCTGRGEIVTPVPLGRPLDLVLACPPVGLSTAEVFGGVTVPQRPLDGRAVREAAESGDVEALSRCLHNHLQATAQRICPAVSGALQALARTEPAGVLMSGSGSTVFALCRGPEEAWQVARDIRSARQEMGQPRVLVVQSCD